MYTFSRYANNFIVFLFIQTNKGKSQKDQAGIEVGVTKDFLGNECAYLHHLVLVGNFIEIVCYKGITVSPWSGSLFPILAAILHVMQGRIGAVADQAFFRMVFTSSLYLVRSLFFECLTLRPETGLQGSESTQLQLCQAMCSGK